MSLLPTFVPHQGISCGRATGPGTDDFCTKPPTWHVLWTPSLNNGLVCDEHMTETLAHWAFYARHSYQPGVCCHPKAVYDRKSNECVLPLDAGQGRVLEEATA